MKITASIYEKLETCLLSEVSSLNKGHELSQKNLNKIKLLVRLLIYETFAKMSDEDGNRILYYIINGNV